MGHIAMPLRRFALLVGAGAAVGCGNLFGPPDRALKVETNKATYVLGDQVVVRMENVSDRHVTMSGCPNAPATIVDQQLNGHWVDVGAFNATCLDNFGVQEVILPPGHAFSFAISVFDTGSYRFRVFQGSRILGISNAFTATQ